MRFTLVLLVTVCLASLAFGQWVETTILLPDSVSGISGLTALLYHSPTDMVYVGGSDTFLISVDARTNSKVAKVAVGPGPHLLCSDPVGNKVYCSNHDSTMTVIDGATNQPVKTLSMDRRVTDLAYCRPERKLYCGNQDDNLVRVINCATDSVAARVPVVVGPYALTCNQLLSRVYCVHVGRDEVSVIDCTADTVTAIVWVRGVEPRDICYDSASECVYTANTVSNTVSVIDCEGDSVIDLVPVGRAPVCIMAGPPGKVYCANYSDSSVSVITEGGVKMVRAGQHPRALSFDPVSNKVYCADDFSYDALVMVIDAAMDTVVARVEAGSYTTALCHNPAGNNTYAACADDDVVSVIGGLSDTVEAAIPFGFSNPGPLCYNTTNDRLYCLDYRRGLLFVIDGDSNHVRKILKTPSNGYGSATLIWNPVHNKVYFTNSEDSTVSILDCASDSIVTALVTGAEPSALCCSDDGKIYVANRYGGVAVIDGSGDSLRTVVPMGGNPWTLCYNQIDNKVYVGKYYGDTVSVIDVDGDSIVASIPAVAAFRQGVCWNQNHNKVYVSSPEYDSLAVIDCSGDTVLRNVGVTMWNEWVFSSFACDKIYGVDVGRGYLRIIQPATDTFCQSLSVGGASALLDNGTEGPANRLYCTDYSAGKVTVVAGYKTDTILRRISVGKNPAALAWNPTHSWMYVSNAGSSSITVLSDTLLAGIEEGQPQTSSLRPQATVVRGVLFLPEAVGGERLAVGAHLLDISGRKVMDLHPGANDVRRLVPGVYFVREAASGRRSAASVRKVIITR